MAPSVAILDNQDEPAAKRVKQSPSNIGVEDASLSTEIRPHPLRIKPSGNALTAESNLRDTSIGRFAMFPDELIIQLLGFLQAEDLNAVGAASKGMYAFSRCEELWKSLFIDSALCTAPIITWRGTWRRSFLSLPASREARIPLPNLYSDALYRPYHMSQLPLEPFTTNIPKSNEIIRLPDLSAEEFNSTYYNTPFILTSPVKSWPGYRTWKIPSLVSRYSDIKFRAESVDWRLRDYYDYMCNQTDESPLYLFDRAFVEKTNGEMGEGFTIPECFGEDYFAVLGDDRPDRRWMILGPERSGSTFHKDPNATSAWNAIIEGDKYWIMFPPSCTPPGVFVSDDQSEVTSPLSIAEWLVGFHKYARQMKGCIEGICRAGEIFYVPSGWWHLVVNLTPTLALTGNFIPRPQLPAALSFLKEQAGSVSGFNMDKVKDPYALFVKRMQETFPKELAEAERELEERRRRKNRWQELVKEETGFTFGFGGGDDDDDD